MTGSCKNPECVRGLTPGVVIRGKGNAKLPVLGSVQTWGWVRCLSCNSDEAHQKAGAVFKLVNRTPQEIAQRAALANSKAIYKPESAVAKGLGSIKAKASDAPTNQPDNSAQLTKLMEQIGKLTEQITELLAENRELRRELKESQKVSASV